MVAAEHTVGNEIKQLRGSVRLSVTSDASEWKKNQNDRKAHPQERPGQHKKATGKLAVAKSLQFSQELGGVTPQPTIKGSHRGVDTATIQQRSNAAAAHDAGAKQMGGTRSPARPARLRPLTGDSGAIEGAPEAWRSGSDPLNANRALRRELAHVTLLRDKLRGDEPPPDWLLDPGRPPPPASRGGSGVTGVGGRGGSSRGGAQSADPRLGTRPTPILEAWSKKLAPSTANSAGAGASRGRSGGGASRGAAAKTPGSGGSAPLVVERPSTTFMRQFLERQPKVGLCMLWSVGPKRMQQFEEKIKASMDDPRKQEEKKRKRLLARMRQTLQSAMVYTPTLASDLWKLYREADSDMSGRIEYEEFCQVLDHVGIGPKRLGDGSTRLLFEVADADGNGSVDFSEFLKAVVGNIVSV